MTALNSSIRKGTFQTFLWHRSGDETTQVSVQVVYGVEDRSPYFITPRLTYTVISEYRVHYSVTEVECKIKTHQQLCH